MSTKKTKNTKSKTDNIKHVTKEEVQKMIEQRVNAAKSHSEKVKANKQKALYVLSNPMDRSNKLTIDIKDVVDFCFCPMYYRLKNAVSNEKNFKELYNESLHTTFYRFLTVYKNDSFIFNSLERLKTLWAQEWIKYKSTKEILITDSALRRDEYESKRKIGIDAIYTFNDMIMKDRQIPIVVNHKYELEIIPNVIFSGTFEYIREYINNEDEHIIQLIRFISESNRYVTTQSMSHNLEITAASYAFETLFNPTAFECVTYDIQSKKYIKTKYTQKDYELLKDTIESVIISIQNNISCISPDDRCYHCEYRNICNKII